MKKTSLLILLLIGINNIYSNEIDYNNSNNNSSNILEEVLVPIDLTNVVTIKHLTSCLEQLKTIDIILENLIEKTKNTKIKNELYLRKEFIEDMIRGNIIQLNPNAITAISNIISYMVEDLTNASNKKFKSLKEFNQEDILAATIKRNKNSLESTIKKNNKALYELNKNLKTVNTNLVSRNIKNINQYLEFDLKKVGVIAGTILLFNIGKMIPFKHNDKGEPLPFFGIGYPQLKLIELSLITTIKLNPLESIYNYAKKKWNDETPSELNEFETDLVATHIATQAFIIVYNGGVKSINFISLKKHDDHFGIIDTEKKPKYISVKNKQDLDTKCKGLLAGFAAEKVILDNEPSFLYGKSNFNKAFKMLKNFLLKGLEKDNLSNELMFKKEDEALRMIDEYILEMENFVKENEYIIKELILQLKIKEELTGQEIKEIIEREDSYESSLIPTF